MSRGKPPRAENALARVMFASGQPGWILDLDTDQIGLIHARPAATAAARASSSLRCSSVHWLPCPQDQLDVAWMPLTSARLTADGIRPSDEAAAELAHQHEAATAHNQPAAENLTPPAGGKTRAGHSQAPLPIAHASTTASGRLPGSRRPTMPSGTTRSHRGPIPTPGGTTATLAAGA